LLLKSADELVVTVDDILIINAVFIHFQSLDLVEMFFWQYSGFLIAASCQ